MFGRAILFLFFGSASIFLLIFAFLNGRAIQNFPVEPTPLTVTAAVANYDPNKSAFVRLQDLKLDCVNKIYSHGDIVPASNSTEDIFVVVEHNQAICGRSTFEPVGTFSLLSAERYSYLSRQGFAFGDVPLEKVWSLCAYCGPANSFIGLILTVCLGIASVICAIWQGRELVLAWRQTSDYPTLRFKE